MSTPLQIPITLFEGFGYNIWVSVPLEINPKHKSPEQMDVTYCPDLDEGHPKGYLLPLILAGLSCVGCILPHFVNFPLAKAIQIVASSVLTAVGYGIANDLLACQQCVTYFTNGHMDRHVRLLKSDDPIKNGIIWGIGSTAGLGLLGGIALAVAARATKYHPITAGQIVPSMIGLSTITCIFAHFKAKEAEAYLQKPENQKHPAFMQIFDKIILPKPGFHPVDLRKVPPEQRAAWFGVGIRNAIGFTVLPAEATILALSIIAIRVIKSLKS